MNMKQHNTSIHEHTPIYLIKYVLHQLPLAAFFSNPDTRRSKISKYRSCLAIFSLCLLSWLSTIFLFWEQESLDLLTFTGVSIEDELAEFSEATFISA